MQQTLKDFYNRTTSKRNAPDTILIGTVLLMSLLGLVMTYTTTFAWAYLENGTPFFYFLSQLRAMAFGAVAFVVFIFIDYSLLRKLAVPILIVIVLLLLAVLVIGENVFGAQRTLFRGSLQPSEFAKFCLVIYAAAWLAGRKKDLRSFTEGLLPYGLVLAIVEVLIIRQPDISTAFVLAVVIMTMYFMSDTSPVQFLAVLGFGVVMFALVSFILPHSIGRIADFQQYRNDPFGQSTDYHIRQLMLTLGGGGFFGHGIGASYQKFGLLPTPHTDSVIAVLTDEMGIIGLLFFLLLLVTFIWRGLHIAQHAQTRFGAYVAIGVTVWVAVQSLMNLLSVLAIIPFTGVPVPFLSLGGSSLVSLLCACGLLASISRGSALEVVSEPVGGKQPAGKEPSTTRIIRRHGEIAFHASADISRRNRRARAAGAGGVEGAYERTWNGIVRFAARIRRGIGADAG